MEKIISLYKDFGDTEYLGDCVSKTTHMLQAAVAAKNKGEPDYLVLACLLHDIGHFLVSDNMGGLGVIEHGKLGADFLRSLGMNEKVCCLIENHVIAKKYLVSTQSEYYDKLSSASKQTLEFQGGRMTKDEINAFEKDPNFEQSVKVRIYDDNAKDVGLDVPPLEDFYNLIYKYLTSQLGMYRENLKKDGFLLIKDYFTDKNVEQIYDFKSKLENINEEKGKWMIYYEETVNGSMRSRIENFTNYNKDIREFLDLKVVPLLNNILNENMVLFKDKLNWKLPNGKGYKAHQDHQAWNDFDITRFYSVALFANKTTIQNGCLEVVKDMNNEGVLEMCDGCIHTDIENKLKWQYLETTPADLLIFDSYTPHRSGDNKTSNSRSIFYFTFNRLCEGDHYADYVSNKRQFFPPPNEREGKEINYSSNKYNLGNPYK